MAVSYTNLLECFNTIGKNFECSFILNNPIYEGGHKDKGILDLELFQWRETREGEYFLYCIKLKNEDCWNGGTIFYKWTLCTVILIWD